MPPNPRSPSAETGSFATWISEPDRQTHTLPCWPMIHSSPSGAQAIAVGAARLGTSSVSWKPGGSSVAMAETLEATTSASAARNTRRARPRGREPPWLISWTMGGTTSGQVGARFEHGVDDGQELVGGEGLVDVHHCSRLEPFRQGLAASLGRQEDHRD